MRLSKALTALKAQGKAAFVPFLNVGDPTIEASEKFVRALARAGADAIELGVPFSDPMADGPINQRSAERALKHGTSLRDVLALVKKLRGSGFETPLVIFTYYNPIHRMGTEAFAKAAQDAGADGVLVLDLPPEEAGEYRKILGRSGLETIFLASPTTTEERLRLISDSSSGFVYYVSRTGVTGVQSQVSATLASELERVMAQVKRPVMVGFGISRPEQAAEVAKLADGVVVGSALVQLVETNPDPLAAEKKIEELARSLAQAARGAR